MLHKICLGQLLCNPYLTGLSRPLATDSDQRPNRTGPARTEYCNRNGMYRPRNVPEQPERNVPNRTGYCLKPNLSGGHEYVHPADPLLRTCCPKSAPRPSLHVVSLLILGHHAPRFPPCGVVRVAHRPDCVWIGLIVFGVGVTVATPVWVCFAMIFGA